MRALLLLLLCREVGGIAVHAEPEFFAPAARETARRPAFDGAPRPLGRRPRLERRSRTCRFFPSAAGARAETAGALVEVQSEGALRPERNPSDSGYASDSERSDASEHSLTLASFGDTVDFPPPVELECVSAELAADRPAGAPPPPPSRVLFQGLLVPPTQSTCKSIYQNLANIGSARKLGNGGFGTVRQVELSLQDGEAQVGTVDVAVKTLAEADVRGAVREGTRQMIASGRSQYIPPVTFLITKGLRKGSFGMPVYKGGTLLDYVNHIHSLGPRSRLSVGDVKSVLAQLGTAILEMHGQKGVTPHRIAHHDLKPENILLDNQIGPNAVNEGIGPIRVIDFGLAKADVDKSNSSIGFNERYYTQTHCGTTLYSPPCVFQRQGCGPSHDWFSFATILYLIADGEDAWDSEKRLKRLTVDKLMEHTETVPIRRSDKFFRELYTFCLDLWSMAMSVEDGFARTSDDLDEWVAQSEVFRDAKKHAFIRLVGMSKIDQSLNGKEALRGDWDEEEQKWWVHVKGRKPRRVRDGNIKERIEKDSRSSTNFYDT